MPAREFLVARHVGVDDAAVQRRGYLECARPVLCGDVERDGRQVRRPHMDQTPFGQTRDPTLRVDEPEIALENPALRVEPLTVVPELGLVDVEPGLAVHPDLQRQPVGQVDQVLILDDPARHLGLQPVVAAGQIAARIVDAIGGTFRRGAAGGEIAVAEREQRLPVALIFRYVALPDQMPAPHASGPPASRARKRCTSSVSRSRCVAAVSCGCSLTSTPTPSSASAANASSSVTSSPI